jgi:hypothetical protein
MSMGGDFYALSDDQLTRLLDGTLGYGDFLYDEIEERPREYYAGGEFVWYELSQILAPEDGCGIEQTDAIPEASGYSLSDDVESVAKQLALLDDEEIKRRYDQVETSESFESVLKAVNEVVDFYQRAAANKEAVLFRVT